MNKMSGLGLSVLTVSVFSVASLSSNTISGNVTSSINNSYCYEAVSIISDENGEMCLSSSLGEQAGGAILINQNDISDNYLIRHKRRSVQLQITKVSKHVSKFDFEEEYEEI